VASLRHEIPRRRLSAAFARGVFDQLASWSGWRGIWYRTYPTWPLVPPTLLF